MAKPQKKSAAAAEGVKKKDRKNIPVGVAHVNASFNNTMVTITDVQGNTFLTGRFGGTIVLGATNLISTGSGDAFWAKINATGTVEWARKAGGTSEDRATSIVKNAKGQIFIAGDFEGVTYFPTTTTAPSLFANGSSDIFLVRVHENGLVPNDGAESPQAFSLQAFPNPFTNQLTLKLSQNAIVEILNLQGQTLHQYILNGNTTLNLTDLPVGVYLLRIQLFSFISLKKCFPKSPIF